MTSTPPRHFSPRPSAPIRITLIDSHPVLQEGIRALLAGLDDIELVASATNGEEGLDQISRLHPEVVVMDINLPDNDGVRTVAQITQTSPETRVLAFTASTEDERVVRAFKAGVAGYLTKEAQPADLVRAIREVHHGLSPIQPNIAREILREWAGERRHETIVERLTPREKEVLVLMARGLSDNEIADQLHIGDVTVRTHVNHVLTKLQAANRVQAVLWAVRHGFVADADIPQRAG